MVKVKSIIFQVDIIWMEGGSLLVSIEKMP